MARPLDKNMSGEEKYQLYSLGFTLIDTLIEDNDFISAYLMTFSILEDRVYSMWYRRKNFQTDWTYEDDELGETAIGFMGNINYLCVNGDLTQTHRDKLKRVGRERNGLVHKTLWNLQNFSVEGVNKLKEILREIDLESKRQKKSLETSPKFPKIKHLRNRLSEIRFHHKHYERMITKYEELVAKYEQKVGY